MGSRKVRVGIVGVGNCASSFVQGLEHYRDARGNEPIPGLMNVEIGGYHVADVEISAAFDIDAAKVGRDVSQAIFSGPNNTQRFANVPASGIRVHRGPTLDGLGKYLRDTVSESDEEQADVAGVLRQSGTEIVVSYLPVGSQQASEWYAERALEAGCAYVNCIPVFLASRPEWRSRFEERGLPIVGDDIKSQVGATIVHRVLANLFRERGVRLDRTYQLNFGGNTDFQNMLDHVPWLTDRKWAYIRLEGTSFGGVPLNLEVKLEVWDSPNSAGIVIDAVRCAKLALDRMIGGALVGPSSYFMKSPPEQFTDSEARERTIRFIAGDDDGRGRSS
jgi:myo-inositol-1-phosphate synthase